MSHPVPPVHLDPERLAALADEAPTASEAEHLAGCLVCRREREAYVALVALAQQVGAEDAAAEAARPLVAWGELAGALRAEGLMAEADVVPIAQARRARRGAEGASLAPPAGSAAAGPPTGRRWGMGLRRAAAALVLVAGGAALGRASAGLGAPAADLAVAERGVDTLLAAGAEPAASTPSTAPTVVAVPAREGPRPSEGMLVADGGERGFRSVAEATGALVRAQRDYQRAAAWLAVHDTTGAEPGAPDALRARLAALDEVMPSVRQALREAPQDPVLNQVYLTTYDVRENTLRQLSRAMPVGVRLEGY